VHRRDESVGVMESSSSVELQSKGGVEKKKKLGEAAAAPGLLSSSVQAAGGGAGDGKLDAEAEEEEFGFDANGEIASDAVVVGNMNESTTTTTKGTPHGTPPFSRRLSRKLTRPDSLDVESMRVRGMDHGGHSAMSLGIILQLAYQSIGVVYGDLGTSPLYVYSSTFQGNMVTSDGLIKTPKDILGALCLIIYTLTLIPLIKYVFIVLQANDNGEGGTFALYSLICRHARIPLAHRQVPADRELSTYKLEKPTRRNARAARIKGILEKSTFLQNALIITVLCGTCLVIGDGSLTPAISVLSAMQGIEVQVPAVKPMVVVILTIVVLLIMFSLQQFGTNKVGFMFAPVVLTWFISIGLIGVYNIVSNDPSVFRALNPLYIISYFHRNKVEAWKSLGGIVLCITGTEAMFADLGHFRVSSIQIAFSGIVFPSLLAAYIGQAAYLLKHNTAEDVSYTFYKSVPKPVFWPMFAVSTGAAIIASQAMISATFSMIRNAMALGCFPRVTVRHTSKRIHGQIYIPEINWLVMCLSISIVAIFRSTTQIGNAYGKS
jgi:KUP system potassium uptake protein